MEVRADQTRNADTACRNFDTQKDQAILAFVPHGIFPFAFAFGCLPEIAQQAFGIFRPVVATATNFFPIVNDFLVWMKKVYVLEDCLSCVCLCRLLQTLITSFGILVNVYRPVMPQKNVWILPYQEEIASALFLVGSVKSLKATPNQERIRMKSIPLFGKDSCVLRYRTAFP